ncbi:hypothetical protein LEP1GSC089_0659 [Leptospira interrogans serovar Autumnalis str. LP101]|nr:hypothetical protein LEP1GSC089_0659 [Leptospira interrogans serovar Autumnalis str. LP101]
MDSGYKDEKGKSIKTIEMKQVLAEGTVAEDTKLYDRYGTEKPDQDRAGNVPTYAENPKYYQERAKQIFKEKGIKPVLDSDGNFEYHNGNKSLVKTEDGFIDISVLTQTQRDQSYLGQTNKEGKPVLYSLPGNRDGDVKDSSACQSHTPATMMASLGYKMTQEEINQYGKINVMMTRMAAEAGQMLPHKPKPSGMSIFELSDMVFKPRGFEIPPGKEGSLIALASNNAPTAPDKDNFDSEERYAQAKKHYDEVEVPEFKKQFQKEHLIPWIKEKLEKGEKIGVGGNFAGLGHVIVITGVTKDGFYTSDSFGDANSGYANKDGRSNHYKFEDIVLGYAYTLKPNGQKPMTETERKTYLKDYTSFPGLKKQQASISTSIQSLENIVKHATDEKKRQESEQKLNELRKNLETTEEEIQRIKKTWGLK